MPAGFRTPSNIFGKTFRATIFPWHLAVTKYASEYVFKDEAVLSNVAVKSSKQKQLLYKEMLKLRFPDTKKL